MRLGHIIVPVGLLNAHHEPLNFFTVYRPEGEGTILPSTWHDTGLSLWGRAGDFLYEAMVVAGLDAFLVWHRGLSIPRARNLQDVQVQQGKKVFNEIGCATCHRPSWKTGSDNYWAPAIVGNYWSWDPKEVWALITMMIYAIALHGKSIPSLRTPRVYHRFMALAFLTILMTFFGVNYFLAGMHSYE